MRITTSNLVRLVTVMVFASLAVVVQAQPVVTNASKLAWDHPDDGVTWCPRPRRAPG